MASDELIRLIADLKKRQPELVAKGIAMMTFNPSIGRVLGKGTVRRFEELAWGEVQKLVHVKSLDEFDEFHDQFVNEVLETITTNKGEKVSYGEAQKPINVFLKVYVGHANLPDIALATRLRPFLHVPLDSVMMKYFRDNFRTQYKEFVPPVINRNLREFERLKGTPIRLGDRLFLKLAMILSREHYYAWQDLFRSLYPENPVLLDFVWSRERRK
ncbi:MAG: hypothetical protein HY672_02865 [Chloroflexi bacterium]|nr:hypothetical protein [Chloroflexota bacterium]